MLGGMKRFSLLILMAVMAVTAMAQVRDRGAAGEPVPPTGNADLRWLDAALYESGFIFNESVREAYYEHCMRLIAPQLHFT